MGGYGKQRSQWVNFSCSGVTEQRHKKDKCFLKLQDLIIVWNDVSK